MLRTRTKKPKFKEKDAVMLWGHALPLEVQEVHEIEGAQPRYTVSRKDPTPVCSRWRVGEHELQRV